MNYELYETLDFGRMARTSYITRPMIPPADNVAKQASERFNERGKTMFSLDTALLLLNG